jgi:hypothetical protein
VDYLRNIQLAETSARLGAAACSSWRPGQPSARDFFVPFVAVKAVLLGIRDAGYYIWREGATHGTTHSSLQPIAL